jgi:hypothetical protein
VRQGNPDCATIGIAARNTYKSGSARVELLDSHCDRLLEGNDDNCSRNADIGFDGLIKMKEQPHKAAVGDCLDLAFDRIICARAKRPPKKNQSRQKYEGRPPAPASPPRALRTVREQPLKPEWPKRHERFQPARAPVTTA